MRTIGAVSLNNLKVRTELTQPGRESSRVDADAHQ
jgi:hypothetical protein